MPSGQLVVGHGCSFTNLVCVYTGLEGAAFASRMPANKMTQQEIEFFPDIAHGSQPAMMEFLLIRNRLLQAWLSDSTSQLTAERAQGLVQLPQSGQYSE